MKISVVVKNTFVHAISTVETDSSAKGLLRTSSCPSLVAPPATSQEYANSEAPTDSPLANLGDWADLDSDAEEEHRPACVSSVGLNSFGFMDAVNPAFKGGEKTPVPRECVRAQTSGKVRTPLSKTASAFVLGSRLNGKGPAFCPHFSHMVNEASDSLVHDIQWQAAKEDPHTNTTVILRNLPRGYTRTGLIRKLNDEGFAGLYNFVYMPMNFKSKACMGYSFVNMADAGQAQHLIEKFDGHHLIRSASWEACTATLSCTQGLAANIDRYRNSPVMGDEVPEDFKPALFAGEQQVPFPKPTKMLPKVQWRYPQ